jgi:ribonuclease HI
MREWWEGYSKRKSQDNFGKIYEDSLRFVSPRELSDALKSSGVNDTVTVHSYRLLKSPSKKFHKMHKEVLRGSNVENSILKHFSNNVPRVNQDKKNVVRKFEKKLPEVEMYVHGYFAGNQTGSYAVILKFGSHIKTISCLCKNTDKNRLELLPVMIGLQALKKKCCVKIHTDSNYLTGNIKQLPIAKWLENGTLPHDSSLENCDLWQKLLALCKIQKAEFILDNNQSSPESKICSKLAIKAMGTPLTMVLQTHYYPKLDLLTTYLSE